MFKGKKNNLTLPQPSASINNLLSFFFNKLWKHSTSTRFSLRRYERRYIAQQFSQEAQGQNVGPKNKNTNQKLAGICGSVKSDGHWYGFQDWINPINNTEHAQKYFRLMKIINNKDDSFSTTRNVTQESIQRKTFWRNCRSQLRGGHSWRFVVWSCLPLTFRFYIFLSSCSCFVCIYINEWKTSWLSIVLGNKQLV